MTKIIANHNNDRNHNSIVKDASLYDIFDATFNNCH